MDWSVVSESAGTAMQAVKVSVSEGNQQQGIGTMRV